MTMTPEDFARAEQLLRDPDAEDCERFSSRYGQALLDIALAANEMIEALRETVALLCEVAPEYAESPVAAFARSALAKAGAAL